MAGGRRLDERQLVVEQLLQFLDIDSNTQKLGHDLWDVLAPHMEPVLDGFYRRVQRAGIEPRLSDATVARLKKMQKAHWGSLLGAQFDQSYIERVGRIGIRHRDAGLDLGWYVAAYLALKAEFRNVIVQSTRPTATKGLLIKTLDQYVAFDMALAVSTYSAAIVD